MDPASKPLAGFAFSETARRLNPMIEHYG
jgi:hypothetical protein